MGHIFCQHNVYNSGHGLLNLMHGVAMGCRGHWLVASHARCYHRNSVGIGLCFSTHGFAIGTQWVLACCFTCMVLP